MKTIKPYKRKNGLPMIYINDIQTKVSLGISERVFTTKLTKGQKKLLENLESVINQYDIVQKNVDSEKIYQEHKEDKIKLDFNIYFFSTDIAKIGTIKTNEDGFYITYKNNLYSLSHNKNDYE